MRIEKIAILREVTERIEGSEYCFLLNYGGSKVTELTELRGELRKLDSRLMVVNNSHLAKVAADQGWHGMAGMFAGPTAIVTGRGEVTEVAKSLMDFVKKSGKATVKGAALDAATLTAEEVAELSKLPSRDVMRGMLLGTLMAPATSFVRVLNAPLLNMLYALQALESQKDGSAA